MDDTNPATRASAVREAVFGQSLPAGRDPAIRGGFVMLVIPKRKGEAEPMAEEFGPDIVIPPDARDVAIWTEISSTDDSGVTIQGIKKDDTIEIESIAGICSFSGQTTGRRVLSVVGIVGGILGATTGIAATAGKLLKSQAGSIKAEVGNASATGDGGGKRRDGYGKDVGGKEFAVNEGGIIVCMPSARGPIYASKDNHLKDEAKKAGRLSAHVREEIRNKCFFPCREKGGVMARTAQEDGTLHILVFDLRDPLILLHRSNRMQVLSR